MRERSITISKADALLLRGLLAARAVPGRDQDHLDELRYELERAVLVEREDIPTDVATLQSRVRVLDLQSGERREYVLVLPMEADVAARRISVLAPLGTALIGYREGDEVEWEMPGGLRRLRIEQVLQPRDYSASGAARENVAVSGIA